MKDIVQRIYENLKENIDNYDDVHLFRTAMLSMARTNKIICMMADFEEFNEIICISEYIEKYLGDFTNIKKKIIDERVEAFLE